MTADAFTIVGRCRLCGQESEGDAFDQWVKPTFTDWDKLLPGAIICRSCLFWFDEASLDLMQRMGKDKPQRMRSYSHFIINDAWWPLSKRDKATMVDLLLSDPFPELAAIAVSGQKHIVFRAQRNPRGGVDAGWVQFEEQRIWVRQTQLADTLSLVESLYAVFSKTEIESGAYNQQRILQFGYQGWWQRELRVKEVRGSALFSLALFLAQRSEEDAGIEADGGGALAADLARDRARSQESLPDVHLGTVRERDTERSLHQQPGEIRQLPLL